MKTEIQKLEPRQLLQMYANEVKRLHYDPCDSYDRELFDMYELQAEILDRMQSAED